MLQLAGGTCPAKALAEEALVAPDLVSNPDQGLLPSAPWRPMAFRTRPIVLIVEDDPL